MATTKRAGQRDDRDPEPGDQGGTKPGDERDAGHASGAGGNGATELGRGEPDASAVLETLLNDSATGAASRLVPGRAGLKAAAKLAARPHRLVKRAGGLAGELGRIAIGRSQLEPEDGDKRFADDAWEHNPAFRALCQAYLAADQAVDGLVSDAELDWHAERRLRFATNNVLAALAPSNFPATNPTVIKAAIDTGGKNFVKGARQLAGDLSEPPRIPTKVPPDAFEVGEDLALSAGAVIAETEQFELIQYEPTTASVYETPLLLVPPMINKYYIADLQPGRSMVEYFVGQGQQTFTLSWRNPDERHAHWDYDTYAAAVLEALDTVEQVTDSERTHLLGLCAGGTLAASVVAHLAHHDRQGRVASLSLGVTVIDQERAGTAGSFMDRATATAALAEPLTRGYISGATLAGVFAWLRPTDLVWRYWVNNYLLGKDPPTFDVLYWNADSTRMPAGLHRDFLRMGLENSLVHPGATVVLDTPVDLSEVTVDSYVVAGVNDHISPWEDAYRTVHLLGSQPRFVLSNSGHIVAMVNPPGSGRASYQVNDRLPDDPQEWLEGSEEHRESWWRDWTGWLAERSGEKVAAPPQLGGEGFEPIRDAPGRYVRED